MIRWINLAFGFHLLRTRSSAHTHTNAPSNWSVHSSTAALKQGVCVCVCINESISRWLRMWTRALNYAQWWQNIKQIRQREYHTRVCVCVCIICLITASNEGSRVNYRSITSQQSTVWSVCVYRIGRWSFVWVFMPWKRKHLVLCDK